MQIVAIHRRNAGWLRMRTAVVLTATTHLMAMLMLIRLIVRLLMLLQLLIISVGIQTGHFCLASAFIFFQIQCSRWWIVEIVRRVFVALTLFEQGITKPVLDDL